MKKMIQFSDFNNLLYNYILQNCTKTPLIFFKDKDVEYSIEVIKFLYPQKIYDLIIEKHEYVKIHIDAFPYLKKNNFSKISYVDPKNDKYFLQLNNSELLLTEKYFIVTLNL